MIGKAHGPLDVIHAFSVLVEAYKGRPRDWSIAAGGVLRVLWKQSTFEDEASLFGQVCEVGGSDDGGKSNER